MWSDPIADMLTRVRNAARVRRPEVLIPSSKIKVGIARVLKEEGYIKGFDVIEDTHQGKLRVQLKYGDRGEDVIHQLTRESKVGCRVYRKVKDLPRVLDGLGIAIVSTSQGVLSDRTCRERGVGGELLCTVY
ncbi:MAG: 30S ribosomal protein S8 [Planctomycetes bacterium]|nr:30S ribosomal protein S8 [Planctomycetota bacterium]MCH7995094.1 30S ribosomal protein S8 [Planctomycetota bacterium]MCH9035630.1 30S ribosomal protein S8 [Planctomycetota bacterium]